MGAFGLLALWVLCGFIAAAIGEKKGKGGLSFLVGLLLGPIGIALAALDKGDAEAVARKRRAEGQVECPACFTWVDSRATRCPACQTDLAATANGLSEA